MKISNSIEKKKKKSNSVSCGSLQPIFTCLLAAKIAEISDVTQSSQTSLNLALPAQQKQNFYLQTEESVFRFGLFSNLLN